MNIIMCTREDASEYLAHGLVLCTPEEAEDYLAHFGIKGQKWGVRQWQNEDGSLTAEGYKHYGIGQGNRFAKKAEKYEQKAQKQNIDAAKKKVKADKAAIKAIRRPGNEDAQNKANKANLDERRSEFKANRFALKAEKLRKKAAKQEDRGMAKFEKDLEKVHGKPDEHDESDKKYQELWELGEKMMDFDKLAEEDQTKAGQAVIDNIKNYEQNYKELSHDDRKIMDGLEDWMINRLGDKSGSWNAGEFRDGSKGKEANDKLSEEYRRQNSRKDEIKEQIGYKEKGNDAFSRHNKAEAERLRQALLNDSVYKELSSNSSKAEKDLCGAVLQDMGFPDTSENRSFIFRYIFVM